MKRMNKKGISPLIATVLLIGFTIALAAIVITWGGGFIQKVTTSTEEQTDLALHCASKVIYKVVSCDATGVQVANRGAEKIEKTILTFYDKDGKYMSNVADGLAVDAFKQVQVTTIVPATAKKVEVEVEISFGSMGQVVCPGVKQIGACL